MVATTFYCSSRHLALASILYEGYLFLFISPIATNFFIVLSGLVITLGIRAVQLGNASVEFCFC